MNNPFIDIESKLGFSQIRRILADDCIFEPGRELVNRMKWETDSGIIETNLQLTEEFLKILNAPESFPVSNYFDYRDLLVNIRPAGTYLEEPEVWQVFLCLETYRQIEKFMKEREQELPLFNARLIDNFSLRLIKLIQATFDVTGILKDNATKELSKIRKKQREVKAAADKAANRIFKEAAAEGYVPSGMSITVRNGRVVLPITAEHKRKIKGIIHDYSATGSIVFIEPDSILEIANQIQDLQHQERKEIIEILTDISNKIREETKLLMDVLEFLALTDFTRSKALFARRIAARKPIMDQNNFIKIINGKHPFLLLQKKNAIPLNLQLDNQVRIVMISGPNAGGKSVALKTVGLFQFMLQCGLLIPVEDNSHFRIFSNIFLDIGDQQSLENDLSTYSSHLRNMSEILKRGDDQSLVLIDEFGSGTDPKVGGAIAEAILEGLIDKQCWAVITTHYSNLKQFAQMSGVVSNAAMLFDKENLKPFYILEQGRQGGSFALEVAQKTGLPSAIIARAKELAGSDMVSLEEILAKLDMERKDLSTKLSQLDETRKEATISKEKYLQLKEEIEKRSREIINDASVKAESLISNANKQIEKTIRHIKENKAERNETRKVRKQLDEFRKKNLAPVKKEPPLVAGQSNLKIGDIVEINEEGIMGEIIELRGKEAVVLVGNIRTKVNRSGLRLTDQKPKPGISSSGFQFERVLGQISTRLDVRGRRAEEAIAEVDKFLDNALTGGLNIVSVIHGKGNGILRKVIRDHLRNQKIIEKFEDEHVERGGDGITVIYLK